MKNSRKPGIICLIAVILIAWIAIYWDTTPSHATPSTADSVFNGAKAMTHLRRIAGQPHSTGTPANKAVREYIVNTCAAMGLDTSIQHATGLTPAGAGVAAANVYNIIARIKGTANTKAILIAAHYDSQPNAGGAGDDGSGCVAMLETARALKAGQPLKNDVIFLFTDAEEDGLLGAHAFVRENPLMKDIGVMLNFDSRGSSGAIIIPETNLENGWIIDAYARSGARRNATSLNYEVYKRLPNSTDYSPFKEAGIAGLNNAFIGFFVNYHAMTDIPDNIDPYTIQQEGDNMLAEARYFGNLSITKTTAPDVTFFNVVGDWFVRYPASLNIVFLGITNILLIVALVIGFRAKQVRLPGLFSGLLALPVILTLLYFVSDIALRGIRIASPLYGGYYTNAYHPGYYFLALTGLGVALFSFAYRWLLSRFSMPSLLAGTLIVLVLITDVLYGIMPTAIYFLCFPLLFLLAGGSFTFFRRSASTSQPFTSSFGYASTTAARHSATSPYIVLLLLLPAILLLTPIFYLFFVAFDLQPTAAAIPALIAILLGMSLPLLSAVFRESPWLLPGGSFAVFVVALTLGLLINDHSPREPFKTNLQYVIDADAGKAHWVSLFPTTDKWNKQFFPHPRLLPSDAIFPGFLYGVSGILANDAPMQNISTPTLTIRKDTVEKGSRMLYLHYQAAPGTNSVHLNFAANNHPTAIILDGRSLEAPTFNGDYGTPKRARGFFGLEYKGIPDEGFDLTLQLDPHQKADVTVLSRSIGLPALSGFKGYPRDIIPGPGNYSNETFVVKRFSF